MKKQIIILFCSLFTIHCSLAQQLIYVDISNNTGVEDGTLNHPFNTILEGLNASQNSDSITVAAGTYPADTLLIEKCVSIAGNNRTSTIVNGTFILSSKLDTLPVLIRDLWCQNVMHSDSSYTRTPLTVKDCGLQTLNDYTPSVEETGRIIVMNCIATDSIHIENASCAARREVVNCETGVGLWVSSISSKGNVRIIDNQVNGCLKVSTISKSDTVFIMGNTVIDSLILLSVASDPDLILNNTVGSGMRIHAIAHSGFHLTANYLQDGSLSATYTTLNKSEIRNNIFLNGGIDFKAAASDINIIGNEIHTDGQESGIRLKTTTGGIIENNTIILPYLEPSGLPFEVDTVSVCGINIQSVSFVGMRGNMIYGGVYGVYLSAISSNEFDQNEIEGSHYGLYLQTVVAYVDSNRIENCIGDGMILDYQHEYDDTNAVYLNHNIISNNGGHGIWTKGNCLMGNIKEPGTGYNMIKDNGGYDLYVETPPSFVDTIWAQNNEWSHNTEDEVGLFDIFDVNDDPSKALVMYRPMAPSAVEEYLTETFVIYPNPTHGKFQITNFKNQINNNFQNHKNKVEVVDLYGKVVKMFDGFSGDELECDITDLPSGVYFVRISKQNFIITKKIIKK